MAKLDIKIYPDPVLKKKAKSVKKITEDMRKLAYDMIETMRSNNGVGLAGPQVGISKRIIVVEDSESKSALALIDPKIVKKKGKSHFCEGCLSLPGVDSDIVRPESIVVEFLNVDGKKIKINASGLLARIVQHEIDHLDGILFIDHISFFKRKRILKEISKNVCIQL